MSEDGSGIGKELAKNMSYKTAEAIGYGLVNSLTEGQLQHIGKGFFNALQMNSGDLKLFAEWVGEAIQVDISGEAIQVDIDDGDLRVLAEWIGEALVDKK